MMLISSSGCRFSVFFQSLSPGLAPGKSRHIPGSTFLAGLIVMPNMMRASRRRAIACRGLFVALFADGRGCLPSAILNLMHKKPAPTNAAESGLTANIGPGAKPQSILEIAQPESARSTLLFSIH
jgi:hypothetical protein